MFSIILMHGLKVEFLRGMEPKTVIFDETISGTEQRTVTFKRMEYFILTEPNDNQNKIILQFEALRVNDKHLLGELSLKKLKRNHRLLNFNTQNFKSK